MIIYVGTPFCAQICTYCCWTNSFGRTDRFDKRERLAYGRNLLEQLSLRHPGISEEIAVDAVFFGGGTPMLLPAEILAQLLSGLTERFPKVRTAPVTVEGTPLAAMASDIALLRSSGFTRVSIGAESFLLNNLRVLGRKDEPDDVVAAVRKCRAAGFEQINIDLMFGFPGESGAFSESISRTIETGVDHISVYPYFPAKNTVMYKSLATGQTTLPESRSLSESYLDAVDQLSRAGYREYIFSLFAREGAESKYEIHSFNLSAELLGFGVGAHSMLQSRRILEASNVHDYVTGKAPSDVHPLGLDAWLFPIMKMLRTDRGIDFSVVKERTGRTFDELLDGSPSLQDALAQLKRAPGVVVGEDGISFVDASSRARYYCSMPSRLWSGYAASEVDKDLEP